MTRPIFFTSLILLISTIVFGQKGNLSPIFDRAPDNESLAISISYGQGSDIYIFSLAKKQIIPLTDGKGYYSRPVFSPKGDKLIYLSKDLQAETSELTAMDLATRTVTKLTDGKQYITEAAFMPNGSDIIFCGAGTISNSSPLVKKAPHDIDLYSININGGESKRLTNFKAYDLSSITPNKTGDTILCSFYEIGKQGIFLLSLADTTMTRIEAVNNPRPEIAAYFYSRPAYSRSNKLISFSAPYQLYLLNMTDKKCTEIWSTLNKNEQSAVIFEKFDHSDSKVYFSSLAVTNSQYSKDAQLYVYDLTTSAVTPITIPAIGD